MKAPFEARVTADRIGFLLVWCGVFISLATLSFPIPVFPQFGIWYQAESIAAGIFLASGLVASGLGLMGLGRPWVRGLVYRPAVLLPLGLAAWSAVAGVFQSLPRAGWFGSPEIGEGVLWYIQFALLAAAGMIVARTRWPRYAIAIWAAAVVLGIAGLTGYHEKVQAIPYVPYFFPDYLAFLGISLMAGLAGLLRWGDRALLRWLAVAVGIGIILVSSNNAAMGLAFVFLPVLVLAAPRLLGSSGRLRGLGVLIGFGVPVAVSLTVFLPLVNLLSGNVSLIQKLANTALSRQRLVDISISAAQTDPGIAFHGFGWGRYSDLLAIHLPVEWAVLHDSLKNLYTGTAHVWDAVHRVDFHSHNYLVDAFIGAGVPGMILALAITGLIPLWVRRRYRVLGIYFAAVLGGTSAYWFQLEATMPFVALAFGAVAGTYRFRPMRRLRPPGRTAPLLFGTMGIALVFMAHWSVGFSKQAFSYMPLQESPLDLSQPVSCPQPYSDGGRGGLHLMHRLRTVTSAVVGAQRKGQTVGDDIIAGLRGLICATEEQIDRGAAFRLLVSSLLARADLAFAPHDPRLDGIVGEFVTNWEVRLNQALHIAPRRTDLAAPYLLWLLTRNKTDEFHAWANRLYARNPQDMVGLWFSGIALLDDPAQTLAAVERMRKALDLGIERIIPVEDQLKRELGR